MHVGGAMHWPKEQGFMTTHLAVGAMHLPPSAVHEGVVHRNAHEHLSTSILQLVIVCHIAGQVGLQGWCGGCRGSRNGCQELCAGVGGKVSYRADSESAACQSP